MSHRDALIDELAPLTPYPRAIDHPEVYRGHWAAVYHNIGKLVGGAEANDQGVGVTASLNVFSMGRLPDIPARFLGNGLEIDPPTVADHFVAQFEPGERRVPSHEMTPRPKLWSQVAYMDDDLRIQLGQLGGHYVMRRTALPMYSIEYFRDRSIAPAFAAATPA